MSEGNKTMTWKKQRFAWMRGVGAKLVAITVCITSLVSIVIGLRAASQFADDLTVSFVSKGEAIALSLAAATEQNVASGLSAVQGSIDSNKRIEGVAYIFVEDTDGTVPAHTFTPALPADIQAQNPVGMDELSSAQRVKVKEGVTFLASDGERMRRAIDIAAPVSGGALGTVHVGMDQDLIDDRIRALGRSLFISATVTSLIGITAALMLIFFIVIRPVRELTRVTSLIVEKGDLTQEIRVRSNDEIGQLGASFGQMVGQLRNIVLGLQKSASALDAEVSNLNVSTEDQSQTLTRQAAALQETQVTAQEIKQTSLLAAQKAEAVLQVAERADEVSRIGEAAIEQSLGALNDIRGRVEEIAQRITLLSERTLQIGGITQTVKDLADQSNMLALNAAVEAVRSGEHGKGFAVVAREIRSLADQSIKATQRVREILDDISAATRAAVAITEKGAQQMEGGLVQIKTSGDTVRTLSGIVRDNSSAVRQIAAAVSQQNAGITQIFTAVTDLSKMMDETMKRLGSTTAAAETLKSVSEQVTTVVSAYRA